MSQLSFFLVAAAGALALVASPLRVDAQFAVYDVKSDANQMLNHAQDLTKYVQMVNNQVQQIDNAVQTLNQLNAYLRMVGDPAQIVNMVGLSPALAELKNSGLGQTVDSLGQLADGAAALQDSGRGLYTTVQNVTRHGVPIPRASDFYRKYDALNRSVYNFQDVQGDTLSRVRAARAAIRQTLARLDRATTQTEVEKLQAVLTVQASELNDLRAELAAAGQQTAVLQLQNANNAEMKRQAAADEFAASFNEAAEKFNGAGQ